MYLLKGMSFMAPHASTNDVSKTLPGMFTLHDKRKILIPRDYSGGLGIKFSTTMPLDLTSKISESTWTAFVEELNHQFFLAEEVTSKSILETFMGCFTCYMSRLCMTPSNYKRMDYISDWLDDVNKDTMIPQGIYIENPIEKGFREMELTLINEFYEPKLESFDVRRPILAPRM